MTPKGKSRLWAEGEDGQPDRPLPSPSPREREIARNQVMHQHEFTEHRIKHSHTHGFGYHQHDVTDLIREIKAGQAEVENLTE